MKNYKILFVIMIFTVTSTCFTFSETDEYNNLVENYKKKIEQIDKKTQKLRPIENVYNTLEFTGYSMSWIENKSPLRIYLSLENSELSEYQIFDFDNGKLFFAYISYKDKDGWQFYFSNNKLVLIIDENKDIVTKQKIILYKHFEKYLLDRAKKLYLENRHK